MLGKRTADGPLWEDPDDQTAEVDLAQEARLRKIMRKEGKTVVDGEEYQEMMKSHVMSRLNGLQYIQWAQGDKELTTDDIVNKKDNLDTLMASNKLLQRSNQMDDVLLIKRICANAHQDKLSSVVQTIHSHPENETLFLAAGFDKHLKIFNIDFNKKLEVFDLNVAKSAFIKDFPIKCARFVEGDNLVMSSLKQSLAFYNLQKEKTIILPSLFSHKGLDKKESLLGGLEISQDADLVAAYTESKLGHIGIVSTKTKQMLFELTMNEGCVDMCFGRNNHELITAGDRGHIYIWDLRRRAIVSKLKDYGSQSTTALAASQTCLLTGSKAGYVNYYEFDEKLSDKPEPVKRFDNLTTTISTIKISPDGTKALFSSKWQKGAIRIADMKTRTIFRNWPNFKTNIGILTQATFSSSGNYVLLGNDRGQVTVYRLGVEDDTDQTENQ